MGVPAEPDEVLTSARRRPPSCWRERLPAGAPVLVVGAEALRAEVRDAGCARSTSADEKPVAVVQGYGPEVGWAELAEASRGGPGRRAVGRHQHRRDAAEPAGAAAGQRFAGRGAAYGAGPGARRGGRQAGAGACSPRRPRSAGARRPLVVGDRLDTDIEGARRAGMDSLLVLTGVSDAAELLAAPPQRRPTYVAADLAGLFDPAAVVRVPARRRRRRLVGGGDATTRWSCAARAARWTPWRRSARPPGRRRRRRGSGPGRRRRRRRWPSSAWPADRPDGRLRCG